MAQADPWAVMGLSRAATEEEIKEQWRRLCKQHHPDLQPAHMRVAAEKHFKEISGAYRLLTSRNSSLAGYAEFNMAAAAAAGRGHAYGSGFHSAWSAGGQPSSAKFSNGVVGAVLFIPLVITLCSGMWMACTFEQEGASTWRPHGLMSPPDNPYLRDDLRPRVFSHRKKREEEAARQQAAEEAAQSAASLAAQASGPASLLPAAAAAVASAAAEASTQ